MVAIAGQTTVPVLPICRRFMTWVPGFEDVGFSCDRRHVDAEHAAIEHVEELLVEDESFTFDTQSVLVGTIDTRTFIPKLVEVVRGADGELYTTPAPPRARDALLVSLALCTPVLWGFEGTVGALKRRRNR